MEEEGIYEKSLRPEDVVPDEDVHYESEEENNEVKTKEKPVGPPLELEIPLRPPPARPDKVLSSLSYTFICQILFLQEVVRPFLAGYILYCSIYIEGDIIYNFLV